MGVQNPVSFTGTLLEVKKTHVSVVLDANKSSELATFIRGKLALTGLSVRYCSSRFGYDEPAVHVNASPGHVLSTCQVDSALSGMQLQLQGGKCPPHSRTSGCASWLTPGLGGLGLGNTLVVGSSCCIASPPQPVFEA